MTVKWLILAYCFKYRYPFLWVCLWHLIPMKAGISFDMLFVALKYHSQNYYYDTIWDGDFSLRKASKLLKTIPHLLLFTYYLASLISLSTISTLLLSIRLLSAALKLFLLKPKRFLISSGLLLEVKGRVLLFFSSFNIAS